MSAARGLGRRHVEETVSLGLFEIPPKKNPWGGDRPQTKSVSIE